MSTTVDETADRQSSYFPDDALNIPGETDPDWCGQFGGTENLIQYFSSLTVPASVTINSAIVTLFFTNNDGNLDTDLSLVASIVQASNQTFFPGTGDLDDTRFPDMTFFDGTSAMAGGGFEWFPVDITMAVQDLVNFSGWTSGNGFWLALEDSSRQGGGGSAANTDALLGLGQLEVIYTGGGGGTNITKISGVAIASVGKISGVTNANAAKIAGVVN